MDDWNVFVSELQAIEAQLQQGFKQLQKRESLLKQRCDRLQGLEYKLSSFIECEVSKKTEDKDKMIHELKNKLLTKEKEMCRLSSSFSTVCLAHEKLKEQTVSIQVENEELKSKVYALSVRMKSMHHQRRPKEQLKDVGVNTHHTILSTEKKDQQQISSAKDSLLCQLLPIVHVENLNIDELCGRTLPVIASVLPSVSGNLLLPLLQFTHWILLHSKSPMMNSSIRRLGVHLCNEISSPVLKLSDIPLLRNDSAEVRMLVALLMLETVGQVDVIVLMLSYLKEDVLLNKQYHQQFLFHQGLDVLRPFFTSSSPLVYSLTVDIHLLLSLYGGQAFLEGCNNAAWFAEVTALLNSSEKVNLTTLEKLSILLQRLSRNGASHKLFRQSLMITALQNVLSKCGDEVKSSFLALNISSVLTNIGTTS